LQKKYCLKKYIFNKLIINVSITIKKFFKNQ
jgi:hypothetical protein